MVEFHVLRCAHCQTFQVQQVTKAKKWKCKLCGEKQSVLKEYGRGTGADCRRHVQKLNSLRGEFEAATEINKLNSAYESVCSSTLVEKSEQGIPVKQEKSGHWDTFLENDAKEESDDDKNDSCERSDSRISYTTDWSTFQSERKQNWKRKREMYCNRWNKTAKYDESSPSSSSVENKPLNYKSKQGFKSCGDVNNYRACHNLSKEPSLNSTKSFHNGNKSFNSNTSTTFNSTNSFVKNNKTAGIRAPSFSVEKTELNLKDSLQHSTPCQQFLKSDIHSSSTASLVKEQNFSGGTSHTTIPLKSSKWSSFMTPNGGESNEDDDDNDNDDDSCFNENSVSKSIGSNSNPLLPSSHRSSKHSKSSSFLTSSKWNAFLNDEIEEEDEEEDDCNTNEGSVHDVNDEYFPDTKKDFLITKSDTAPVEEDKNLSSFISRTDKGGRSSLFQVDDLVESWDLDL